MATLAATAALSLVTGSPRALLARDGLATAAWAAYMYASLLAQRPATFTVSRPLLEGRRVFDPAARAWVRPSSQSWDELWQRVPRFRRIWRACTVIWGTAILAGAAIRGPNARETSSRSSRGRSRRTRWCPGCSARWPWADEIAAAVTRLQALPACTRKPPSAEQLRPAHQNPERSRLGVFTK